MRQSSFRFLACVAVLLLTPLQALHAQEARTGSWELNLAKSKFDPGPGPKQQTRVDMQTASGLDALVTGTTGTGTHINYRYAPAFNGPAVAIVGTGVPSGADSISIRRVDARTVESTLRRAGSVVLTRIEVVSADGKVLTITSTGLDVSGKAASNTTVYDLK